MNSALPMPVPRVSISTTRLAPARPEPHLGQPGRSASLITVTSARSPGEQLARVDADPGLVDVGRGPGDAADHDAGEGDARLAGPARTT